MGALHFTRQDFQRRKGADVLGADKGGQGGLIRRSNAEKTLVRFYRAIPVVHANPDSATQCQFLIVGGMCGGANYRPSRAGAHMSNPTEFFRWWIIDERTNERRLTTYALSRADAARAFPGAEPDLQTRETRHLPNPGATPENSRSGDR